MNKEESFLIETVKQQCNAACNLDILGVDFNGVLKLAKMQVLTPFVYYAIIEKGLEIPEETLKKFEYYTKVLKTKDRLIVAAANEIIQEFENNGIAYLPLKGYVIKKLYSKSELRFSQDFDVLVKKQDIEKTEKLMLSLGYVNYSEDDIHHRVFYNKSTFACVEIHNSVFEYDKYNVLGLSLENAIKDNDNKFGYHFSAIDYYTHMLCHSSIHFATGGGVGLRSVIDIFVYLSVYKNEIDYAELDKKLDKVGLVTFKNEMEKLCSYLFFLDKPNEITEKLEKVILSSSTLSNKNNQGAMRVARNGNKIKAFFRMIFPKYQYMVKCYKWLKKCPILLLVAYLIRAFKFLFFRRKTIKAFNDTMLSKNSNVKEMLGILSSLKIDDLGK